MDIIIVTEETTDLYKSAGFDGGDAEIAAEVVVLNEDAIPTSEA